MFDGKRAQRDYVLLSFATAILLGFSPVRADNTDQKPTSRLLAVDGGPGEGVPRLIECFQSKTVLISAVFLIGAGETAPIVADVYLDGGHLGAPIARNLRIETTQPAAHPALLEGVFRLGLPESTHSYQLLVVFRNQMPEVKLGEVRLRVSPDGALKEALTRLKEAKRPAPAVRIVLAGNLKGLRDLLSEWRVPFDDSRMEVPGRIHGHSLAIVETRDVSNLPQLEAPSRMLLVSDDPHLEMDSKEVTEDGNVLAVIRKPPKDDWRQSPYLQRILVNQINQHLQTHE
jgi:hypothetical protein